MMKNIGVEKLKLELKSKSISQVAVGTLTGIPQPTISRHLSGDRIRVSFEAAVKYEKAFGIPKEDFFFLV